MHKNLKDFSGETAELIKKSKAIAITTHTNPDGDAIGSAIAVKYIISENFNKSSEIFIDNDLAENLVFLEGAEKVTVYNESHRNNIIDSDLIFILDLNNPSRLKSLEESVSKSIAKKIMIDHHINPTDFTDLKYVDTEATSTGDLVFKWAKELNLKIPKPAADALYVAIMTDTGNFRHSRTDADTFRTAAHLIDCGADPVRLYENVYNQNKLTSLKLLGYAFNSLELFFDDKVSVISLPEEIIKTYKASKGDIEGFVEKTLSVKGAVIGILLTEFPESNEVKISLRSKGDYSVRDIAAKFDGGGHKNAAGAKIENKSIKEAKEIILKETANILSSEVPNI